MDSGEISGKLFSPPTFLSLFLILLSVIPRRHAAEGLRVLILHPYGTGSHVKTLLHLTGISARMDQ